MIKKFVRPVRARPLWLVKKGQKRPVTNCLLILRFEVIVAVGSDSTIFWNDSSSFVRVSVL
jgi:hypothetical protein